MSPVPVDGEDGAGVDVEVAVVEVLGYFCTTLICAASWPLMGSTDPGLLPHHGPPAQYVPERPFFWSAAKKLSRTVSQRGSLLGTPYSPTKPWAWCWLSQS